MKRVIYVHPIISIFKRAIDLIGASVGLIIFLPLFPIIALVIKISSPGPVFYCQQRVGRIWPDHVQHFKMIKFRSMRTDAEAKTGPVWAQKNDPRLTRVGIFLRKTRLDELPQFINVIKGEMSLIGPRPERPMISDKLEIDIPFYTERTYGVVPGITGLAQVNQGYDENLDDVRAKLAFDFAYSLSLTKPIHWLAMDAKIMIKTIMVMVLGRGQ
jgi:lipopolysaccharide/colanic/teichoic acid biosynthesis glycosyltransferase